MNITNLIAKNKDFAAVLKLTAAALMLLCIAMQFSSEANWTADDFAVMGTLVLGTGSLFVLVSRITPQRYRTLIGFTFLLGFLWLWAELAVGIFTNWGS